MYSAGNKFIVEVEEEFTNANSKLYRIKGFNSLVFDENGLRKLERYDPDEKSNADYDAGYAEGMDAAWEAAKKIVNFDVDESAECFSLGLDDWPFEHISASEAIKNICDYEKKKEAEKIRPGDIVYNSNNYTYALVLHVMPDGKSAQVAEENHSNLAHDGILVHCPPVSALKKTRKRIELVEALKQMRKRLDY